MSTPKYAWDVREYTTTWKGCREVEFFQDSQISIETGEGGEVKEMCGEAAESEGSLLAKDQQC